MLSAIPGELLAAIISALVIVGAALAVAIARLSNRITRLEEWVRLRERD